MSFYEQIAVIGFMVVLAIVCYFAGAKLNSTSWARTAKCLRTLSGFWTGIACVHVLMYFTGLSLNSIWMDRLVVAVFVVLAYNIWWARELTVGRQHERMSWLFGFLIAPAAAIMVKILIFNGLWTVITTSLITVTVLIVSQYIRARFR